MAVAAAPCDEHFPWRTVLAGTSFGEREKVDGLEGRAGKVCIRWGLGRWGLLWESQDLGMAQLLAELIPGNRTLGFIEGVQC